MSVLRVLALLSDGSVKEVASPDIANIPLLAVNGDEVDITIAGVSYTGKFAVHSEGVGNSLQGAYHRHSTDAVGANVVYAKSRGTSAAPSVVVDGDQVVGLYAVGHDGTDFEICASIAMDVSGTVAAGQVPGEIHFSTATAAGALTQALRLLNTQETQFYAAAVFDAEVDNGDSGAADTVNWKAGNKQKSTLTGNCTYTFTAPSGPCNMVFKLVQDGTGSRTVTWPATVKWPGGTAPTLTTTPAGIDIVSIYYDGTNYYAGAILAFA